MLLVAAFMGEENWRNLYNSALENDYRFLSYGDSSLLVR
jgi:S-adenosylmethionine:tRNA ribosyltransferase-isomerase